MVFPDNLKGNSFAPMPINKFYFNKAKMVADDGITYKALIIESATINKVKSAVSPFDFSPANFSFLDKSATMMKWWMANYLSP
jgi:hypothetical protein